jgi:hypothetical protein
MAANFKDAVVCLNRSCIAAAETRPKAAYCKSDPSKCVHVSVSALPTALDLVNEA